eukprot:CAMPEP_0168601256 /NCGR_PEP_ID=MMETSP0420-20121227/13320_1 /TAXON_ID=498008 /ORGANISM="Pessonella sp." /LENGTH=289 /DNA_ID=CAMNT_0008639601 /DNA_START=9 /DNA_END=875 /DNA_ORIENTATION=-
MSDKRKSNSYLPSILAATGVGVLAVCCVLGYRHWQPFVVKTMLDPNPIRVALSLDRDWHGKLGLSTKNYEVCLTAAGAVNKDNVDEVLSSVDAVVIGAGGDIHPDLYESTQKHPTGLDKARDEFEIKLVRGAYQRNMPCIGVCHGNQLMNVAFGGKLRSLKETEPAAYERHGPGVKSLDAHSVEAVPGSWTAKLLNGTVARVSSFHGMAVSKPGSVFTATSHCVDDGVIESTEATDKSHRFFISTQFHPEFPPYTMQGFFNKLVEDAKDYRVEKDRLMLQQNQKKFPIE